MISIVTAYYNRRELFIRTLESIKNQNHKSSFEVIAVDDGSDEHERLEDLTAEYLFLKIIRLEKKNKWYSNSCVPFNIGFKAAKGDKIIIQNPECLHYGNVLDYVEKNLTDTDYLCFSCFSLDKEITDNLDDRLQNKHFIEQLISSNALIHGKDGRNGWYSHSEYRPMPFHFCTAITNKNLKKLGGFDELFSLGIAYDDNEFLCRINKKKLNVRFIDNEIVLHQNHYLPTSTSYQSRSNKEVLMEKNLDIYRNITINKSFVSNRIIKNLPSLLKAVYIPREIYFWKTFIGLKKMIKKIIKS
ncbi:glycosyltransferase family 2 protein [Chryseobacterium luquanense]|uniref:Glycosyltransferase family 2 protein n=1 Tax=Chryseobacterium luquanense TaxID=2983766 RepID=A0ABT3Y647_9FLAO|nr:glycosyltransferase family 2 protein [Chryseobacterium luquanense]MCX8533625.1 glycosyltransferase family 2 protein [Chryseobacterium luquanense]